MKRNMRFAIVGAILAIGIGWAIGALVLEPAPADAARTQVMLQGEFTSGYSLTTAPGFPTGFHKTRVGSTRVFSEDSTKVVRWLSMVNHGTGAKDVRIFSPAIRGNTGLSAVPSRLPSDYYVVRLVGNGTWSSEGTPIWGVELISAPGSGEGVFVTGWN